MPDPAPHSPSPEPAASVSPAPGVARQVLSRVLDLSALTLGWLAWELGLFMNFIFLLVLLLAPLELFRQAWKARRKELDLGLLRRPFAPESRRYWWPCLARAAFFLACGYLLAIAIVPFQFPQERPLVLQFTNWGLVACLCLLAFVPSRHVSWFRAGCFTFSALCLLWQFIQIATPPQGEPILLSAPLRGYSCVVQGGNSSLINHHHRLASQRDAIDIFKVADTVEELKQWKILKNDASFGQTIHSPCDGRIAFVEDAHPDNLKGPNAQNPAGNYLTIEVGTNRFVMLAHLKRGSILVKPGDAVKTGQPIAQCGNSGNTTGPHVHVQVQTSAQFSYETQTVPMAFREVLRGGNRRERTQVKRNDLLWLAGERK